MNYSQKLDAAFRGETDGPYTVIAMDGERNGYSVNRWGMDKPYVVIIDRAICRTANGNPRRFGDTAAARKFAEKFLAGSGKIV